MTCIFIDLPISSYHSVMGCVRKLHPGTKKGDGALSTTIEDHGGVRREPRSPGSIRECASFRVKVADSIVGSRDFRCILQRVSISDSAHVSIQAPRYRAPLWMSPDVLSIRQERYALLMSGQCFCL